MGVFDREVDRPAYQEMMRRVRDGEFTHIVVERLESLLHDYDDLKKLLAELTERGISFVNVLEQAHSHS